MENLDYKKAKNCLHGQLFLMSEDELRETGLIWYEENRRKEITYAQLKGEVLKILLYTGIISTDRYIITNFSHYETMEYKLC